MNNHDPNAEEPTPAQRLKALGEKAEAHVQQNRLLTQGTISGKRNFMQPMQNPDELVGGS